MLYRYTSAKHERQPNQAAKPEFRAGTASIVVVPDTSSALPKTDSGFDPAGCRGMTSDRIVAPSDGNDRLGHDRVGDSGALPPSSFRTPRSGDPEPVPEVPFGSQPGLYADVQPRNDGALGGRMVPASADAAGMTPMVSVSIPT